MKRDRAEAEQIVAMASRPSSLAILSNSSITQHSCMPINGGINQIKSGAIGLSSSSLSDQEASHNLNWKLENEHEDLINQPFDRSPSLAPLTSSANAKDDGYILSKSKAVMATPEANTRASLQTAIGNRVLVGADRTISCNSDPLQARKLSTSAHSIPPASNVYSAWTVPISSLQSLETSIEIAGVGGYDSINIDPLKLHQLFTRKANELSSQSLSSSCSSTAPADVQPEIPDFNTNTSSGDSPNRVSVNEVFSIRLSTDQLKWLTSPSKRGRKSLTEDSGGSMS
ncbi:unnamed protein product [Protopolystoma xenopodis]|uniref:Uncharacterized protein n=1 Tax=Protopolystoma xenopodis TaxID=117903 RepID=A0A448WLA1_9PLAT|nr:unnamed protein product [Protopolystoma xenopodis]